MEETLLALVVAAISVEDTEIKIRKKIDSMGFPVCEIEISSEGKDPRFIESHVNDFSKIPERFTHCLIDFISA